MRSAFVKNGWPDSESLTPWQAFAEWHLYDNDYAETIDGMSVIHHLINDLPNENDYGQNNFFVTD